MNAGRADQVSPERIATAPEPEKPPASPSRPSVDDMSEWSFPASDPPATWTWEVDVSYSHHDGNLQRRRHSRDCRHA